LSLLNNHPEYLGRLLNRFVETYVASHNPSFLYQDFINIYSSSEILTLLDSFGDQAFSTQEEAVAIKLFREAHSDFQGTI